MTDSLSIMAYERIAAAIGSGEIPPGTMVSEQSLARRLNVSRTPVREAIRRLRRGGVVEQVPRYGTIVKHPDRTRLAELYELREALECYAIGRAVEGVGPDDIDVLAKLVEEIRRLARALRQSGKAVLEGERLERFLVADMSFHMRLLQAAGNRTILEAARDSRALTGIFGTLREPHDLSVLARSWLRHARILRAVRAGDASLARDRLAVHIRESRDRALAQHDKTYALTESRRLHEVVLEASRNPLRRL